METILAAIDFSDSAKPVIARAVTLSRALNARLVFLHVIQPVPGTASEYGFTDVAARIASAAVREASQRLAHLQRQLLGQKIRASAFHVRGVPGSAIIEHAQELEASYIVIGSHGHGALYELIVGSTASRVINEATCSVVVVPTRTQAPGEAPSFDFEPAAVAEELQTSAYALH
jgi:nucleotide-binding universal stress UspA family protein